MYINVSINKYLFKYTLRGGGVPPSMSGAQEKCKLK